MEQPRRRRVLDVSARRESPARRFWGHQRHWSLLCDFFLMMSLWTNLFARICPRPFISCHLLSVLSRVLIGVVLIQHLKSTSILCVKLKRKNGIEGIGYESFIKSPFINKYETLPLAPAGFEDVKRPISGLVVLRVITGSAADEPQETYEAEHVLPLARQIVALNKAYWTSIPLLLAGDHKTWVFVEEMARRLTKRHLPVLPILQNIYPVLAVEEGVIYPAQVPGLCDPIALTPLWYAPGDGELLSSLFKNPIFRSEANVKCFLYFANSQDLKPIIDLRILNFLLNGEESNFCLETVQRTPMLRSSKDICSLVVKTYNKHLKLVNTETAMQPFGYDLEEFGSWSTNNMWVRLSPLQELSDQSDLGFLDLDACGYHRIENNEVLTEIRMDAASAVEKFSGSVIVFLFQEEWRGTQSLHILGGFIAS